MDDLEQPVLRGPTLLLARRMQQLELDRAGLSKIVQLESPARNHAGVASAPRSSRDGQRRGLLWFVPCELWPCDHRRPAHAS
jgi:hypothetical protein